MIIKGRFTLPEKGSTQAFFATNPSIEYHLKSASVKYAYEAGDGVWHINIGGQLELATPEKPSALLETLRG